MDNICVICGKKIEYNTSDGDGSCMDSEADALLVGKILTAYPLDTNDMEVDDWEVDWSRELMHGACFDKLVSEHGHGKSPKPMVYDPQPTDKPVTIEWWWYKCPNCGHRYWDMDGDGVPICPKCKPAPVFGEREAVVNLDIPKVYNSPCVYEVACANHVPKCDQKEEPPLCFSERKLPDIIDINEAKRIYDEKYAVFKAMQKWGGGFVSCLGQALANADVNNTVVIARAFPVYWASYLKKWNEYREDMAKKGEKVD